MWSGAVHSPAPEQTKGVTAMAADDLPPIDATPDELAEALADGLYDLASRAGDLERLLSEEGGAVSDDEHLRLDQAHSNASAIVASLERLGFG